MGLLCPDSVPSIFGVFDFSIAPPLLFYTYVPVVVVSIAIGIYILVKDHFSLISKLLFVLSVSFALWVFNIFFAWIAAPVDLVMISWVVTPVFEILIFSSAIYLTLVFLNKNRSDISFKAKLVLFVLCVPILLALPTRFNITHFDLTICEGVPSQWWYFYIYALEIISIPFIIILSLSRRKKLSLNNDNRKQVLLFTIGMSCFLALFVGSNLIGQLLELQQISFIGSIGMVVFIALLAYLILKYRTFDIGLLAGQVLVMAIIILVGSEFFFVHSKTNLVLVAVTFVFSSIFGWYLIRSIKREAVSKLEIEQINKDLDASRQDLEKANNRLQKLDKTKSEFLSIASHQLRTPISGIKGYLSMILEGDFGKIEEKPKEILQSIYDNTERLNGLVNDFLDVSRIERGKLVMERQPTDIAEMVQSVVVNFQPVADAKGIKLDYSPPKSSIPQVNVDPNKLRQVALNLVDNAIKYTSRGSIHVTLEGLKDRFRVCVKDTGVGLDPDEAKNLFRPFVRTADSSKSNATGSGLGLYVARKIVQYHGGKVWAESEGKGKGSTFCMEVPYDQSTLPEPEPEPYLE